MKHWTILVLIFLFSSCKSQPKRLAEEAVYNAKSQEIENILKEFNLLSLEVEKIYKKETDRVELYLQEEKGGVIKQVPNFNDVPESFFASYNIIKDNTGRIFFIGEYPYSESGDWNLAYESYFDGKGNLIAFIRKCGFFNGECAEIIHEKSEYYYDLKHKLIKKTYEITDENKKPLDFNQCIFNYRFDYQQYLSLKDYLAKKRFN